MTVQQAPECCEVLINGKPALSLSLFDRSIHYGDGLFETIALRNGELEYLSEHLVRLEKGAAILGMPAINTAELIAEIKSMIGSRIQAVMKVIVTRGSGGRGYQQPDPLNINRIIYCYPWPVHYDGLLGLRVRFCETPVSSHPLLKGIKHLNRLENVLARNEWSDDYHEGLMADIEGNWIEGTMSNLFWINDGVIYTPLLQHAGIEGIMRAKVMDIADKAQIPCKAVFCSEKETLLNADELFMTNSLFGIKPVNYLNGKSFTPGELTQRLQSLLKDELQ
jgi:4-amino-4-deoxychorismate lyase